MALRRFLLRWMLLTITVATGFTFALAGWACAALGPREDRRLALPGGLHVFLAKETLALTTFESRDFSGKLALDRDEYRIRQNANRFIDGSLLGVQWRFFRFPASPWYWFVILPIGRLLLFFAAVCGATGFMRARLDRAAPSDGFGVSPLQRNDDDLSIGKSDPLPGTP